MRREGEQGTNGCVYSASGRRPVGDPERNHPVIPIAISSPTKSFSRTLRNKGRPAPLCAVHVLGPRHREATSSHALTSKGVGRIRSTQGGCDVRTCQGFREHPDCGRVAC